MNNPELELYREALMDRKFLKQNYGIKNVDIHFIGSFQAESVIRDYKEWKGEDDV